MHATTVSVQIVPGRPLLVFDLAEYFHTRLHCVHYAGAPIYGDDAPVYGTVLFMDCSIPDICGDSADFHRAVLGDWKSDQVRGPN
eukprot:1942990-Rhodomonas_salina.4